MNIIEAIEKAKAENSKKYRIGRIEMKAYNQAAADLNAEFSIYGPQFGYDESKTKFTAEDWQLCADDGPEIETAEEREIYEAAHKKAVPDIKREYNLE